jgi:hypothetical protein
VSAVADAARAEWLVELEGYLRQCGCGAGGVGAMASLLAVIAWQLSTITAISVGTACAAVGEMVAAAVLGGVAGKLIGLARARIRFRRATSRLLSPPPGRQPVSLTH